MYRDPKKGGTYRQNLLMQYTNILLFKGETKEPVAAKNTHISQLHFTGNQHIAMLQQRLYVAINVAMCIHNYLAS